MPRRVLFALAVFLLLTPASAIAQPKVEPAPPPLPKTAADPLDGPPFVSAKAWAIADGKTGKVLWSFNDAEARPMASTSKIMTAWIVLRLAAVDAKVLDETITYSEHAAKTPGSSARLSAGEKVPVRDLLFGLMLPSGNDAAVALAEHFGPRFGDEKDGDALERFIAEMNRRAKALGLKEMAYRDPNGLSRDNVSSVRDLAALAREAMKDERFRSYVATRRHECEVVTAKDEKRKVVWTNTNKLLDIEGYEGVKTGTTTPAGNCLVASARRGEDRLIVVVLGSTAADGRYIDARNLFRWAWRERGHKPVGAADPDADDKTEKVVAEFLKGIKAGKPDQLTPLAGVPWLADGQRVIADEKELKKLFGEKFGKPADPALDFEVREPDQYPLDEPLSAEAKKLFDRVIGKKGWIVLVVNKKVEQVRYVLVRSTDAGPKVVGGPYPLTYLLMPNAIPAAAAEALAKPDSVELLSLDPDRPKDKPKDDFHGWKVLGRTTIKDDAARKKLTADLAAAAEASEGLAAACFNPRHGLCVTRNGKTIDLVICFECLQVQVFEGDKDAGEFLITDTPQPAFDKVLRDAGVTLPAKPEK